MMEMASDPMEAQLPSYGASGGVAELSSKLTSFRFLVVDGRGTLSEVFMSPTWTGKGAAASSAAEAGGSAGGSLRPLYEAKGAAATRGDWTVHKVARGQLRGHTVIALARKDGRIDVMDLQGSCSKPWITLQNAEMKKGIHRWVGLAVAHDGLFACTSAGDFRFYSIEQEEGSSASLVKQAAEPVRRELPEPLQQVTFAPASDPTHFAYGGEEIPLSVWAAKQAISGMPELNGAGDHNGSVIGHDNENEENAESAKAMNGKARKRKRAAENRAKARELLWGEIYRAKNLPNDALSLPQRADIVSVTFVGTSRDRVAVGTRSGLVRIFEVGPQRRHLHEFRVFAQEKGTVKSLTSSHQGDELIVTDTTGRLFVLDARSGVNLFSFRGIHGAIVSWDVLPPMIGRPNASFLVTASADRLIRLHSVPIDQSVVQEAPRKSVKNKGVDVGLQFVQEGLSAVVWDGTTPEAAENQPLSAHSDADDDSEKGDGEENVDDGMWDAMATIDESQRGEAEEDVEQVSEKREARSKRRK